MKIFYLIAAIVGAVVPCVFFLDFFATHGVSLAGFATGLFVNGAAGGFAADVLISSGVFWGYMFAHHGNGHGPAPWPFVLVNLLIGLSCALPLYLYFTLRAEA